MKEVQVFSGENISIKAENDQIIAAQFDGEIENFESPVKFGVKKSTLKLIIPAWIIINLLLSEIYNASYLTIERIIGHLRAALNGTKMTFQSISEK